MSSFNRKSIRYLLEWKERAGRKPLILRGARQVGKTTLVRTLAVYFDHYIELNLEKGADREIFETTDEVKKILQLLFLRNNILRNQDKTVLLFIDEIQHSANAIRQLRYFFEEAKEIHVIAAGSVLESLMNRQISFPVGRVEYLMLRPFSYDEFLDAAGEKLSLDILDKIPVPDYAHGKLMDLFTEYCLIGGMPEIIKNYIEHHDLVAAGKIFRNLITTYLDDVEK
ncbi:MAG: AAA family ATPase, partial [Bacteroidetes bacterium]|nr:AAA family ATPase [Bacteroidota bacterium]